MPHSAVKKTLQAVILCGPGVSLGTFSSNPDEYPKALIPIANRPMVWYPIDLCHRMGVFDITLITPRGSEAAISQALEVNLHLNSFENTPKLLAPKGLEHTAGTTAIFRLPEVQSLITGDFIVLPCDLVCELNGPALLNTWMVRQPSPASHSVDEDAREAHKLRGGLTMWYDTKGEDPIKGEETDFFITAPFPTKTMHHKGDILTSTAKLVYSAPTDTLNDITEENHASLPIRHGLVRKYPRLRMFTQHRDAHFYICPAWIIDMINANPNMESLAEDIMGWWAKAEWQTGLEDKLGLRKILKDASVLGNKQLVTDKATSKSAISKDQVAVPPIIAYIHPSYKGTPLVRRVDTSPLLLSTSLELAKLASIEDVGEDEASPLAHATKISASANISGHISISRSDSLIGFSVKVEEHVSVKESVVGSYSHLKKAAKLMKCVLMEGVVIGERCRLTNCIIGRKVQIGADTTLTDCEVEDGYIVEAKTVEKGEKIMSSEGLEVDNEESLGEVEEEDEDVQEKSGEQKHD